MRRLLIAFGIVCAGVVLRAAIPVGPDAFTAANGTVLDTYNASWEIAAGQMQIQGNAAAYSAAVGNVAAHRWLQATDNFSDDQSSQATCAVLNGANDYCYVIVRSQGLFSGTALTQYQYGCNSTDCYIQKMVNNTATTLATVTGISAGDVLKLTATGGATTTLKGYVNGAQNGSDQVDSSSAITGGQPGIYIYTTANADTVRIDNWTGDNVSVGGSTPRSLGLLGVGQ